jgi:hypothetical protein
MKLRLHIFRFALIALCFFLPAVSIAQITFERTYGGISEDFGRSVQQTLDGGYIIAGGSNQRSVYLVKTDSLGDTLWTSTYPCDGYSCFGQSAQQTLDGGYVIIVYENWLTSEDSSDICLIKIDAFGNTMWRRNYGDTLEDEGYSVQQTTDKGFIMAGITDLGFWNFKAYIIKTDSLGDTLWTKTYGDTFVAAGAYSIKQTFEGGYIITGFARYFGLWNDVYLIKTDSMGETLWTRTYDYNNNTEDFGKSVQQTSDGGFIIAGLTSIAPAGINDIFMIKTDSLGDTLWTRTYGNNDEDWVNSVYQTTDGGYIIAGDIGYYSPDLGSVYLMKLDAFGDSLWSRTYGGANRDYGRSVQQTSDGGYIVAGGTNSFGVGDYDVYLIKTDGNGLLGVEEEDTNFGFRIAEFKLLQNQPNPFNKLTAISYQLRAPSHTTLKIYDLIGRLVETLVNEHQEPGIYQLRWNGKDQASGIYFYRLNARIGQAENITDTKKLILLK